MTLLERRDQRIKELQELSNRVVMLQGAIAQLNDMIREEENARTNGSPASTETDPEL